MKRIIWILLIGLFLRVITINSDLPYDVESSTLWGDEGDRSIGLRNLLLYSEYKTDEDDLSYQYFILNPVPTFFNLIFLKLTGISISNLRILSTLIIITSLLFLYLILKRNTNWKSALLSLTLISFNFYFLTMSRMALHEIYLVFFMVITLYFFDNKKITSGIMLGLSYLSKYTITPLILAVLSFSYLKKYWKVILSSFLVALLYFMFLVVPFYSDIKYFYQTEFTQTSDFLEDYQPSVFNYIKFFTNFFKGETFEFVKKVPFIFILFFFSLFTFKRRTKNIEKISLLIILFWYLFFGWAQDIHLRYHFYLIIPMIILSNRTIHLSLRKKYKPIIYIILALFLIINVPKIYHNTLNPSYTIFNAEKEFQSLVSEEWVIGGDLAPAFCMSIKNKCYSLTEYNNQYNYDELEISHIIMIKDEDLYLHVNKNYPEILNNEPIKTFYIKQREVLLYEYAKRNDMVG